MENRIEELERELKATSERLAATREQMRLQNRRARQLVAAWTVKVEEKEREMRMLRILKDGQLQSIVRQLLRFESLLRQEQKRIVDVVHQKDQIIRNQAAELDQLRQANRKQLFMAAHEEAAEQEDDTCSANPVASKMAKLDHCEDKENVLVPAQETPLVTKMVRRFEQPPSGASRKPDVPKKPARLLSAAALPQPQQQEQQHQQAVSNNKGVVRTDSVNDHGYFTLEKRKPVKLSVTPTEVEVSAEQPQQRQSPTPLDPPQREDLVADETDLRQNFEEFHLMDSLEEEEQLLQDTMKTTPDRSCGDGAERTLQTPPPSECTSLSLSSTSGVRILPQLGDATPTSGVQFDRFLDVSGLTQKSILTPSRLLSNHKNMLKPKDIKHRHMINKASQVIHHHAAVMMSNCRSSDPVSHHHSANHVRYYVEPFL